MKRIDNLFAKAREAAGLYDFSIVLAFVEHNATLTGWKASAQLYGGTNGFKAIRCGDNFGSIEDATAAIEALAEKYPNPNGCSIIIDNIPDTGAVT